MEKLTMCRICLVENVRMHKVTDRHLQETFEKLTHIAFITEDRRPMLACYFCYARLKQCSYFMMKCLEAEEMFAQMLDEDYEQKPVISQDTEFFGGFIKTTVDTINIVDVEPQVDSVKEELSIEYETDYDVGKIEVDDNNISDGSEVTKKHSLNILKEILEDSTPNQQKEYGQANSTATDKTRSSESETVSKLKEPSISYLTQPKANDGIVIREYLKKHIRTHTGEKSYECDMCGKIFNRKCHLKEHIRIHTREKPYKCNTCANSFSQMSTLMRHKRTHTGEKPYKCDVCQTSFTRLGCLNIHIRVHTNEHPYKCDICQRSFKQKGNLKSHIRTHTGEKPYTCDVCQKCFNGKNHLKAHIRTHTGEKPHKCDVCQKCFNRRYRLKTHIRKFHKCDGKP